jgi:hypothetical protein
LQEQLDGRIHDLTTASGHQFLIFDMGLYFLGLDRLDGHDHMSQPLLHEIERPLNLI